MYMKYVTISISSILVKFWIMSLKFQLSMKITAWNDELSHPIYYFHFANTTEEVSFFYFSYFISAKWLPFDRDDEFLQW